MLFSVFWSTSPKIEGFWPHFTFSDHLELYIMIETSQSMLLLNEIKLIHTGILILMTKGQYLVSN